MQKTSTKQVFFFLTACAVVATGLSLWLNLSLFVSAFLFWGVPALYFSSRLDGRIVWRAVFFALLVSATIGPAVDYIALVNDAWAFPNPLLPFYVFGPVTLDDCLWLFFYIWGATVIFETLTRQKLTRLGMRFYWGLGGLTVVTLAGYLAIAAFPNQIREIPYVYLLVNLTLLAVPLFIFLKHHPIYRKPFIRFTLCLLPAALMNEVVGLALDQWTFPSTAELLGRLPFIAQPLPIEELFFITLAAPAFLAYYIYFIRNSRMSI